jgi:hypothetical protein
MHVQPDLQAAEVELVARAVLLEPAVAAGLAGGAASDLAAAAEDAGPAALLVLGRPAACIHRCRAEAGRQVVLAGAVVVGAQRVQPQPVRQRRQHHVDRHLDAVVGHLVVDRRRRRVVVQAQVAAQVPVAVGRVAVDAALVQLVLVRPGGHAAAQREGALGRGRRVAHLHHGNAVALGQVAQVGRVVVHMDARRAPSDSVAFHTKRHGAPCCGNKWFYRLIATYIADCPVTPTRTSMETLIAYRSMCYRGEKHQMP